MSQEDKDRFDDFVKPSRQNRGGKKRKNHESQERAPKDVYKRQRISRDDVHRVLDENDEFF